MITKKSPDERKAKSVIEAASRGMNFVESSPINVNSGPSIIREIYESFRMLGDALLTAKGFETTGKDHHAQMISELVTLRIQTERPLILLHELRKMRHKINYEGYLPMDAEIKEVIAIKDALWKPLFAEVKRLVEKKD